MLCSLLKVVTLSFTFSHLIPCDRRDDGAYSAKKVYLEIASGNGSVSTATEKKIPRGQKTEIYFLSIPVQLNCSRIDFPRLENQKNNSLGSLFSIGKLSSRDVLGL